MPQLERERRRVGMRCIEEQGEREMGRSMDVEMRGGNQELTVRRGREKQGEREMGRNMDVEMRGCNQELTVKRGRENLQALVSQELKDGVQKEGENVAKVEDGGKLRVLKEIDKNIDESKRKIETKTKREAVKGRQEC